MAKRALVRAAGYSRKCVGEKNSQSKLTNAQVVEILGRNSQTQQSIADEFHVNQSVIARILKRESWSHVKVTS